MRLYELKDSTVILLALLTSVAIIAYGIALGIFFGNF